MRRAADKAPGLVETDLVGECRGEGHLAITIPLALGKRWPACACEPFNKRGHAGGKIIKHRLQVGVGGPGLVQVDERVIRIISVCQAGRLLARQGNQRPDALDEGLHVAALPGVGPDRHRPRRHLRELANQGLGYPLGAGALPLRLVR